MKDKKKDKRVRDETWPGERAVKEKFPNTRKPSYQWVYGEFWNLRGQHNQEGTKTNKTHRIHALTTTPNREIAHTITSATSKRGRYRLHA